LLQQRLSQLVPNLVKVFIGHPVQAPTPKQKT